MCTSAGYNGLPLPDCLRSVGIALPRLMSLGIA
ncbi:hypothetical protein P305_09945 [Xylella fastidiosa subsp. fastidiosa Mus-1]|nr:hypothetical protein P305_09945 [Xylella fastidiosa subsp. fastidiosa Mus-1]